MTIIPIKSMDLNSAEVSWFAPLCSDDFRIFFSKLLGFPGFFEGTGRFRKLRESGRLVGKIATCPGTY